MLPHFRMLAGCAECECPVDSRLRRQWPKLLSACLSDVAIAVRKTKFVASPPLFHSLMYMYSCQLSCSHICICIQSVAVAVTVWASTNPVICSNGYRAWRAWISIVNLEAIVVPDTDNAFGIIVPVVAERLPWCPGARKSYDPLASPTEQ